MDRRRGNDQEIDHFIIIKIVSQFIHHSKFTALQMKNQNLMAQQVLTDRRRKITPVNTEGKTKEEEEEQKLISENSKESGMHVRK
jgi:hypothetical protein